MERFTLDASAVLALLQHEPGGDIVAARLRGATISAVNLVEVLDKLVAKGMPPENARAAVNYLQIGIRPFTEGLADRATALLPLVRPLWLSLANRVCLALAQAENATALTADRIWKQTEPVTGIPIMLIRNTDGKG